MTAEQLEELLRRSIFSEEDLRQLSSMASSLARKVIAAEKLVEAVIDAKETAAAQYKGNLYPENGDGWESCVNDMLGCLEPALTAYREASKCSQ